MPVKTRITKARWHVENFTPQRMLEIAQPVSDSVKARILSGVNVQGSSALPLSMKYSVKRDQTGRIIRMGADRGYRAWKAKKFPPAIRNWKMTGFSLSQMGVVSATNGQAVIGFKETTRPAVVETYPSGKSFTVSRSISVNKLIAINQAREQMFGMSRENTEQFIRQVRSKPLVMARQEA